MNTETDPKANERRLLRAMTDVSDQYILDAAHYGENSAVHKKGSVVHFRKWFAVAAAAAACFAIVIVGSRVTNVLPSYEQNQKTEDDITTGPYEEVSSLSKAEEIAGFDLSIPDAEEPYSHVIYTVIDGSIIEASYYNEDETEMGYYVRKAPGNDDISGDYEEYAQTVTQSINGNEVTLRGNNDMWYSAIWTSGEYTYAVGVQDHPMTMEQITNVITAVR